MLSSQSTSFVVSPAGGRGGPGLLWPGPLGPHTAQQASVGASGSLRSGRVQACKNSAEGEYQESTVATGRQLGHLRGTVNVPTAAQMPGHDTASASLPLPVAFKLASSESPARGGRERAPPAATPSRPRPPGRPPAGPGPEGRCCESDAPSPGGCGLCPRPTTPSVSHLHPSVKGSRPT